MLQKPPPRRFSKSPLASKASSSTARTVDAGRYRLEEIVGLGGMGEVWAAYDTKLSRRVAIKLVDVGNDRLDDTAARFALETVLSKQLRGPAFVEVFAHGTEGAEAFLVMELLEGETLQQRLRRRGSLSLAETHEFLNGLGGALRLAHALQIVHRDLKPANIFFAKLKANTSGARPLDGRSEVLKLLDFGIAKDAWDDARLTRPGVLLGSAHYMSPEQIRCGSDVDARSDLWSLAVLLFRALTGVRPFTGSAAEALGAIVEAPAPRASTVRPELGRRLDPFFAKAFQKDPANRFQTVDELIDAFRAANARKKSDPDRLSIDVEFDDLASDGRPTVIEGATQTADPADGRPTVLEGAPREVTEKLVAVPKLPPYLEAFSGSGVVHRAQEDSDAREALLPLVMPVTVTRARAPKPIRRSRTTAVLVVVFVLLAIAIAAAWYAGNSKTRLFVIGLAKGHSGQSSL